MKNAPVHDQSTLHPPVTDTAPRVDPLLDTAPCGFVSFTDDGRVRSVNATFLEMLGLSQAELLGQHIETVLSNGARISYQTLFFPLLRLEGRADEIFLLLRAKDGSDVGAIGNAVRRQRDGEWVTDCMFLRLRERKKFEDALLRAKKAADEARLVADEQRRRVDEMNTRLQLQTIELEMGQQQLMEQAEELESQTEELRTLREALTDRSEELQRLRSVADEASHARSAVLATMIRELRTPLDAIGGPVTEAHAEALARIAHSQRHLLQLINDVLNLARVEAGRVDYDLEPFALRAAFDAIGPIVEPQLKARQLDYEMNIGPDLAVYADRKKVQQILVNLLSNASRFTPPDGRVTVDAFSDRSVNGVVYLRVMDTGVGIAADRLDRVFDPFVLNDNHAGQSDGARLGLAVSRGLARGMGGDLRVRSEVGVGSSFTLTLPRANHK